MKRLVLPFTHQMRKLGTLFPPQPNFTASLISGFQPPELEDVNFLCLSPSMSMVIMAWIDSDTHKWDRKSVQEGRRYFRAHNFFFFKYHTAHNKKLEKVEMRQNSPYYTVSSGAQSNTSFPTGFGTSISQVLMRKNATTSPFRYIHCFA